jgi:hypothetical protein
MRLPLNQAVVPAAEVAECRAGVVPVWSSAVVSTANYRFRFTIYWRTTGAQWSC